MHGHIYKCLLTDERFLEVTFKIIQTYVECSSEQRKRKCSPIKINSWTVTNGGHKCTYIPCCKLSLKSAFQCSWYIDLISFFDITMFLFWRCRCPWLLRGWDIQGPLFLRWGRRHAKGIIRPYEARQVRQGRHGVHRLPEWRHRPCRRQVFGQAKLRDYHSRHAVRAHSAVSGTEVIPWSQLPVYQRLVNLMPIFIAVGKVIRLLMCYINIEDFVICFIFPML